LQKIYKIYLDSSLQQLIINYANIKAFFMGDKISAL